MDLLDFSFKYYKFSLKYKYTDSKKLSRMVHYNFKKLYIKDNFNKNVY